MNRLVERAARLVLKLRGLSNRILADFRKSSALFTGTKGYLICGAICSAVLVGAFVYSAQYAIAFEIAIRTGLGLLLIASAAYWKSRRK
jgi:hypothetical protein